jgi:hypothetical protein
VRYDDPVPRLLACLRAHDADDTGRRPRPAHAAARHVAALLLVAVGLLLRPLDAASPPDPTWIAGVYDDADLDNVVGLAGGLTALGSDPDAAGLRPDLDAAPLATSQLGVQRSVGLLALLDRSPPRA